MRMPTQTINGKKTIQPSICHPSMRPTQANRQKKWRNNEVRHMTTTTLTTMWKAITIQTTEVTMRIWRLWVRRCRFTIWIRKARSQILTRRDADDTTRKKNRKNNLRWRVKKRRNLKENSQKAQSSNNSPSTSDSERFRNVVSRGSFLNCTVATLRLPSYRPTV